MLFVAMSVNEGWGQLLQQDFSSSSTVSTYVSSSSPTNGQFNAIGTSGSGTGISINGNALQYARTGNAGSYSRTNDFSPTPTSLIYKFDLTVSGNTSALTTAATWQTGNGFGTTNSTESGAKTYARIGLNFTAINGTFSIRDLTGGTNSVNFSGTQVITWVMNNSGSSLTYKAPDGTFETVANDKSDIWIGTTRSFNDVAVETPAQSITDLKFAFTAGIGTIKIDNILIDPIPLTPTSNVATNPIASGFQANWSTVTGVSGYRLDVSTTSDFSTYVSGYNDKYISGQSTNNYNITDLNPNTTYYYRVRGASQYTGGEFASGNSTTQNTTTTSGTSPNLVLGSLTDFGNQCINSTYGPNSFTISGTNLTADDVTVGALSGYTYSTSIDGSYSSTLSIPQSGGSFSQTIYVKFSPTASQSYSGNISVGGGGASSVNCATSGTGVYAEPTDHPAGLTATANSSSQITVTWTDASGAQVPAGYIVKAAADPSSPSAPADGTAEADATLAKNIAQGTHQAVFTGLSASTTYNFSIWPYTNSGSSINYKTDGTVVTGSATTETPLGVPVATAATDISATGFTANWGAAASATGYDVNVYTKTGGSGSVSVTQGFDAGTTAQTDWIFTAIGGTYTSNDNFGASSPSLKFDNDADAVLTPTLPSSATELSFWMKGQGVSDGSSLLIEGYNGFNWVLIHNIVNPTNTGITYLYTSSTTPALPSNLTQFRFTYTKETGNIAFDDVNYKYGSAAENIPVTDSPFTVASSTNKVITSLNPGTEYFYTVVAKNPSGSSAASNEISVTTDNNLSVSDAVDASTLPDCPTCDLVVNNGGVVILNASKSYHSVSVKPHAKLTLNNGHAFTPGTFILESDNTGTATFVDKRSHGNKTAITATVQQYLPAAADRLWWYLASPVSDDASTVFGGNKIGEYNETTRSYSSPFAGSTALVAGKGYVVKMTAESASNYVFSNKKLNTGDISIGITRTVTATADNSKRGFNLVGNPYPSYLNWDMAYNASTNVRPSIWYRTLDKGSMTFHTYNATLGASVPSTASGYIPPMQAFWVKVDADPVSPATVSNGTINLTNDMRSHNESEIGNPLKAPAVERPLVRLAISNGSASDETVIVAHASALDVYDRFDSEKISNENANVPEIYSLASQQELVINGISPMVAGQEIELGMRPGKAGDFTINATQFENIPSDIKVILKDKLTGAETELSENASYSFNTDGTEANQRFSLLFRAPGSVTGIDNAGNNTLLVYAQQSEIVVNSEELKGSNITVYTATGQSVLKTVATANREVLNGNFTPGVYFVKVNNTVKKVSVK